MIRRQLLGLLAGSLWQQGDGLRRPVNAPPSGAPVPGVQPGTQNGVVIANQVIVFGANGGVFVYSPTPGLGTLIASITAQAGTDRFGNATLPGFTTYVNDVAHGVYAAMQTDSGVIAMATAPGPGGPYVASGSSISMTVLGLFIEGNGTDGVTISPSGGPLTIQGPAEFSDTLTSTGGTAASPTVITTDGWNALTLINGWASVVTPKYSLLSGRMVMVAGVITSAGAAGNPIFATLPAGPPSYRPATQQETSAGLHGAAPAGGAFMRVATNGDLSIPGSTAVTGPWSVSWTFSLDYA